MHCSCFKELNDFFKYFWTLFGNLNQEFDWVFEISQMMVHELIM